MNYNFQPGCPPLQARRALSGGQQICRLFFAGAFFVVFWIICPILLHLSMIFGYYLMFLELLPAFAAFINDFWAFSYVLEIFAHSACKHLAEH